jgi:hypothetical protein
MGSTELIHLLTDSAASAVRNLNDYEIMNRKLRVDFSNDGGEEETVRHIAPGKWL